MRGTELHHDIQLISSISSHLKIRHMKDTVKNRLCLPIKYKTKRFQKHFLTRLHSCLFYRN